METEHFFTTIFNEPNIPAFLKNLEILKAHENELDKLQFEVISDSREIVIESDKFPTSLIRYFYEANPLIQFAIGGQDIALTYRCDFKLYNPADNKWYKDAKQAAEECDTDNPDDLRLLIATDISYGDSLCKNLFQNGSKVWVPFQKYSDFDLKIGVGPSLFTKYQKTKTEDNKKIAQQILATLNGIQFNEQFEFVAINVMDDWGEISEIKDINLSNVLLVEAGYYFYCPVVDIFMTGVISGDEELSNVIRNVELTSFVQKITGEHLSLPESTEKSTDDPTVKIEADLSMLDFDEYRDVWDEIRKEIKRKA